MFTIGFTESLSRPKFPSSKTTCTDFTPSELKYAIRLLAGRNQFGTTVTLFSQLT